MGSMFEVVEKTALACIATAIVAVLTLAAIPKAELDSNLRAAVQLYFWSVPFLAGYLALTAVGEVKPNIQEFGRLVECVVWIWFAFGYLDWLLATLRLMDHFGLPAWEGVAMLIVFFIPYAISMYLRRKPRREEKA